MKAKEIKSSNHNKLDQSVNNFFQPPQLFSAPNLKIQDFKIFKILLSTVTPTGALVKTFNKSNTINIRGKLQALVLTTG